MTGGAEDLRQLRETLRSKTGTRQELFHQETSRFDLRSVRHRSCFNFLFLGMKTEKREGKSCSMDSSDYVAMNVFLCKISFKTLKL